MSIRRVKVKNNAARLARCSPPDQKVEKNTVDLPYDDTTTDIIHQTNDIRLQAGKDNTNTTNRRRLQTADISKRTKNRTKTDSADKERPINSTLHQYFSTDLRHMPSKKRTVHSTESSQRLKRKNIQIIKAGTCEDPHVDSVDSSMLCMQAHTVHTLRPIHTSQPADRQCDFPSHDKQIADS